MDILILIYMDHHIPSNFALQPNAPAQLAHNQSYAKLNEKACDEDEINLKFRFRAPNRLGMGLLNVVIP
jgi:hypothetical protein